MYTPNRVGSFGLKDIRTSLQFVEFDERALITDMMIFIRVRV